MRFAALAIAHVALIGLMSAWPVVAFAETGPPQNRDEWIEEVLLQLSELRKAQGEMREQLNELATAVESLQGGEPIPERADFDLRSHEFPLLGQKNAPIAIVEFSDFECPFCRRYFENTMPALKRKYVDTGRVQYVFVDFPLDMHLNAMSAAVAGACAQAQGAFWEMRRELFAAQQTLDEQTYVRLAASLHLDGDRFAACRQDPRMTEAVRERVGLGQSAGVQGTPSFLIGRIHEGVLKGALSVSGAQPIEVFEQILNALIDEPLAVN